MRFIGLGLVALLVAYSSANAQDFTHKARVESLSRDAARVVIDSFFELTAETDIDAVKSNYESKTVRDTIADLVWKKSNQACGAYGKLPRFADSGYEDFKVTKRGKKKMKVKLTFWVLTACID